FHSPTEQSSAPAARLHSSPESTALNAIKECLSPERTVYCPSLSAVAEVAAAETAAPVVEIRRLSVARSAAFFRVRLHPPRRSTKSATFCSSLISTAAIRRAGSFSTRQTRATSARWSQWETPLHWAGRSARSAQAR